MEDRISQSVRPAPRAEPGADAAPPPVETILLDRAFGHDEITVLRHAVAERLAAIGLGADRRHGYILAVNEVITNVVLHAGGHGRLLLRIDDGSVWCLITDSGPGIPGGRADDPRAPEAFEIGGRGLWLAHQLCDEVTTATGPIGTSIGLRMTLNAAPGAR